LEVVQHHGPVPVPVDVDARTLAPRLGAWKAAVTPRASRSSRTCSARGHPLELLDERRTRRHAASADPRARGLRAGSLWAPTSRRSLADVSMFSFGPIKTATALAGRRRGRARPRGARHE
jgi:dTDP-4-amino-4,6-dideoxygalactose transaminase